MHRESLARILDLLGINEEEAAIEYRKLHQRLSRFFEWNGVDDPMALADEAIDRLGKRAVEEGAGQRLLKPTAFALGIARLLLQEEFRRKRRAVDAIQHWEMQRTESIPEAEAMDEALQGCLAKLQPDRRRLLERYYLHTGRKRRGHIKSLLTKWASPLTPCGIAR